MSASIMIHFGLFMVLTAIVVAIGCMLSEAEDRDAIRSFPKRYGGFLFWSGIVVAGMLIFEHTLASIH